MTAPSAAPASEKPRRSAMQVLRKALKWTLYLFLCLVGLFLLAAGGGLFLIEAVWYLAFGWIHFIVKNLASVELNPGLLAEGIVSALALGVGAHYFCRWLYREAGLSGACPWRWQWTASGLGVVLFLFVAGIGTIGVVHQAAWLFGSKDPLLVDDFSGRARFSEAVLAGVAARTAVIEYYASKGRLPQNGDEAGYPRDTAPGSKYVSAVEIREKGVIVVTLNIERDWPDGGEITLTPTEDAAAKTLNWKCRSTLPPKLVTASCRD